MNTPPLTSYFSMAATNDDCDAEIECRLNRATHDLFSSVRESLLVVFAHKLSLSLTGLIAKLSSSSQNLETAIDTGDIVVPSFRDQAYNLVACRLLRRNSTVTHSLQERCDASM